MGKRVAAILFFGFILFGVFMPKKACGAESLPDYQVKAAFLFNFIKFVEWPERPIDSPDAPLVVCILGKNRIVEGLAGMRGKEVKGRRLVVREVKIPEEVGSFHLLFVSKEEWPSLDLASIPPGVLTIGESEGFINTGGMINFVIVDNRVRFDINNNAARKSGLTISSHLLRLARHIKE